MRSGRRGAARRIGVVLVCLAAMLAMGNLTVADERDATLRLPLVARHASAPYPVNRVGVGFLGYGALEDYPLEQVPFGWYSDYSYRTAPQRPNGVAYVQLLPVGSGYPPDWARVEEAVRANPGSVWIIGNEPECAITDGDGNPMQGNLTPQEYAAIYHDYYTRVTGWDPTARFAIGGVVQPSPARFTWLEKTLQSYRSSYGRAMPIDVWTLHNMILEEQPDNQWGGGVPKGLSAWDLSQAQTRYSWWPIKERLVGGLMRYEPCDNRRPDYFEKQLWAFRRWMAVNGFRGKELWITEYGVLYPAVRSDTYWPLFNGGRVCDDQGNCWMESISWYGGTCEGPFPGSIAQAETMGADLVKAFMSRTLDYAAYARDASYGMPSDSNRLVQRWLWYSLNGKSHDEDPHHGFNGSLANWQAPHDLTEYGLHWEAYFGQ